MPRGVFRRKKPRQRVLTGTVKNCRVNCERNVVATTLKYPAVPGTLSREIGGKNGTRTLSFSLSQRFSFASTRPATFNPLRMRETIPYHVTEKPVQYYLYYTNNVNPFYLEQLERYKYF